MNLREVNSRKNGKRHNIPNVKDQVLCIFLPNGIERGFCLGNYYSEVNRPPVENKNIYYKKFDDGTSIQYDKVSKELTINSVNLIVINGSVKVNGNISSTGIVTGSNITAG